MFRLSGRVGGNYLKSKLTRLCFTDFEDKGVPFSSIAITTDFSTLILGNQSGKLIILNLESGVITQRLDGHTGSIQTIFVTKNDQFFVSYGTDRKLKIWDLQTLNLVKCITNIKFPIADGIIVPDNMKLITINVNQQVECWDIIKGEKVNGRQLSITKIIPDKKTSFHLTTGFPIVSLNYLNDKFIFIHREKYQLILTHGENYPIWFYRKNGQFLNIKYYNKFYSIISILPFHRSKRVLLGDVHGDLQIINLETGYVQNSFSTNKGKKIKDLCLSPNERYIAYTIGNNVIHIWDLYTNASTSYNVYLESSENKTFFSSISKGNRNYQEFSLHSISFCSDNQICAGTGDEKIVFINLGLNDNQICTNTNNDVFINNGKGSEEKPLLLRSETEEDPIEKSQRSMALFTKASQFQSEKELEAAFTSEELKEISLFSDKIISNLSNTDENESFKGLLGSVGQIFDVPGSINLVKSSNRQNIVVGLTSKGVIGVWDKLRRKLLYKLQDKNIQFTCFNISADGRYLITGSNDGMIRISDICSRKLLKVLKGHKEPIQSFTLVHNDKILVSSSMDKEIRIWDLESEKSNFVISEEDMGSFSHHYKGYEVISLFPIYNSPNFLSLHLVKDKRHLGHYIWDFQKGKNLGTLKTGKLPYIYCSSIFSKDTANPNVITGNSDGSISIWDISSEKLKSKFSIHNTPVWNVIYAEKDELIISSDERGNISVTDRNSGETQRKKKEHTDIVTGLLINRELTKIISSSKDGTIGIWDYKTLGLIRRLKSDDGSIWSVTIVSNENNLIAGSGESIQCWDLTTGNLLYSWNFKQGSILSLITSPNDNYVLAGCESGIIFVINVTTGLKVATIKEHTNAVSSMSIVKETNELISGGWDNKIQKVILPDYLTSKDNLKILTELLLSSDCKSIQIKLEDGKSTNILLSDLSVLKIAPDEEVSYESRSQINNFYVKESNLILELNICSSFCLPKFLNKFIIEENKGFI